MMKFVVPFLLVLASIGLVTGQRMCIQGGAVPDCNSFSLGLEAVWSQSSCQFECPKVCPNGDAFRSCDKCASMRCRDGTTCYNDRCAATCTGQCVPNPTSTPTTPPETPICTEACTAKCSAGQSCVLSTSCQPKCERSTANTCVLNDDNSRIVFGGKYYHQCNICECGANGQPGGCTKIGCGDGPFHNNGSTISQCLDCRVAFCASPATCIPDADGCGKCVTKPTPTPKVCTGRCTAKCFEWQDCVLEGEECKPTCKAKSCSVLRGQDCPASATCVDSCPPGRMCATGNSGTCQPKPCAERNLPGCSVVDCRDGYKCVENPDTCEATCEPPTCHNFQNKACPDESWKCVTNPCTMAVCIPERPGTCVKKTTPTPKCVDCTLTNCGFNSKCEHTGNPRCGKCVVNTPSTPTPTPTPATPTCDTLRGKDCPDDSWECVVSPCPTDACVQRPGTCVKKPKICTEKCTAKCHADESCVFGLDCTPGCLASTSTANTTCVLNDNNSRIVSGGKYYHTCNLCTCMDGGQGACDRRGCPHSEEWNNDGSPVPPPTCHNFQNKKCPDESWECVTNKCPTDKCIFELPGTCVKRKTCAERNLGCATVRCSAGPCVEDPITCEATCPKPICTEKCVGNCNSYQTCVFNDKCQPKCQSSFANTCVLNDGSSRIVSGGRYYEKCNLCECGKNGQHGVCTEMGCIAEAYFNSGAAIKLYTISFNVTFYGTRDKLITQLRTVAEKALSDSNLVAIEKEKIAKLTYKKNTYQCTIAIKGTQNDETNRDKYIKQLKKQFTVAGQVQILENNGDNDNQIQLDGEIQIEPNTQPFTTQTCPDDTTIPAMNECPAITEEAIIIPTATSDSSSSSFPLAIVIGSVVGGVIALVILTAAIIVVQRRRFNTIKSMDRMETEMTNNPAITSQV